MAAPRTHYEILNVAPDAELVVIEAAYRALMKKYHPDQGGGAAHGPSATDINRAYAALRDPERRADYDHKEWIRQRDIRLAAYQPPPPRASNFFGWGGWLVAAVLAAMIALMASKGGAPQLSDAEQARAATMAAPDTRSQPLPAEKSLVTPAEAAAIRADAYAGRAETPKPPPPPPPQAPQQPAAPAPAPVAAVPPADHLPPRRAYAARHAAPRHGRRVALRHDKDFLERQGYIY